jgi:hypothetical protein
MVKTFTVGGVVASWGQQQAGRGTAGAAGASWAGAGGQWQQRAAFFAGAVAVAAAAGRQHQPGGHASKAARPSTRSRDG